MEKQSYEPLFHSATNAWFQAHFPSATPVQTQGWPAIAAGEHVLISAPTGTGKTLTAFLVFIDRLQSQARRGELPQGVQLLYISPLKALGNDIRANLRKPLEGIAGPELSVAVRTGDTTQAERQRMIKHPPHILITTPESLYLLLTSGSGRRMLSGVKAVIIDELHALINGKRGAHLMLSLARLDKLCGHALQRVGLSATIEPLEEAAGYLASPDPVTIVAPQMRKLVDISVVNPTEDMRILPQGTIWPEIARTVYEHCEGARTVIVFLEGRAQAEKLAYGVNALAGEGFARTHHGCVSKEQRLEAEQQLRSGALRLLCATSSMELGIDVGEVDLVLQVGYPRTVSSAMQRLGRAGHNPGRTSVMRLFPRTALESLNCGLTAKLALEGGIERVKPPRKCLDVLAQHLVSLAVNNQYTVDDAMDILRRAYPFQCVTKEELRGVLRMLAGDFEHMQDRPVRPRILYDRIHETVAGDTYSRMLAVSAGGTIPDRGMFAVRLPDGTKLGELDEEFVFEARVGDKFLLGSFAWRIQEIKRDSVTVNASTTDGAQSPFWKGDGMGRAYQTGRAFGALLRELNEAHAMGALHDALRGLTLDDAAATNAEEVICRQIEAAGCLADDRTIVVEHFCDQVGSHQIMVHSVFGGQVNAGLSLLMKDAVRREAGMNISCFDEDDGFLLFPYGEGRVMPDGMLQRIAPERAKGILSALLPTTPVFSMAFRYNSARALLMGTRNGKRQPLWVQRLRGAQALDEAILQNDHPILYETRRECLEDYWDLPGIEKVLTDIQSGAIAVREVHLKEPSPLSLPFRRQAEAVMMYDYDPAPASVYAAAQEALAAEAQLPPAPEQLAKVGMRAKLPQDAEQLHSLLMAEGDLVAGDVDAPVTWLEELLRRDRACYIEPGLWICAEQRDLYAQAIDAGDEQARQRIVRRCLRYRGAQHAGTLSDRYFWPEEECARLLSRLVASGAAVQDGEWFYHAELYSRARHETIAARRNQIQTLPPERYAALLSGRMLQPGSPQEQLRQGLCSLLDQPYPAALWESVLLPARTSAYRPALLDELLAGGEFFWQMIPGDKPMVVFHRQQDIDWAQEPLAAGALLEGDALSVARALQSRGASFAQALSGALNGKSAQEALLLLAERGLARADSFLPVRQWLDGKKALLDSPKQRARARATAATGGRWELTRPLVAQTLAQALVSAFDRAMVLCRETSQGVAWTQALEMLRVWEYTGKVRRGYFVRGLSGAQFIRDDAYHAIVLALQSPQADVVWLHAVDPAQVWGRCLSHAEGRAFTCVPGTAVALRAGVPVMVIEKNGQQLRVFDWEYVKDALSAFALYFQQGRIFPGRSRITVKEYPKEAEQALVSAGFSRQMLDYELLRRHVHHDR